MVFRKPFARRVLFAAVASGTALLGPGLAAQAQPAPPAPPTCSAADLAGIMSGITAATSVYLFTNPPVNDFFTSLKDVPAEEKRAALQAYVDANPQVKADLQGIRQPAVDFRNRCG
ncbi:MAG: heme-binding protein [Mycolicibacterium sp.]|uniref:heme-binding protein n=1 Tax=Mycolicibacterium sp. TaxID=2320850 RepID=UPI003D0A9A92